MAGEGGPIGCVCLGRGRAQFLMSVCWREVRVPTGTGVILGTVRSGAGLSGVLSARVRVSRERPCGSGPCGSGFRRGLPLVVGRGWLGGWVLSGARLARGWAGAARGAKVIVPLGTVVIVASSDLGWLWTGSSGPAARTGVAMHPSSQMFGMRPCTYHLSTVWWNLYVCCLEMLFSRILWGGGQPRIRWISVRRATVPQDHW